MNDPSHVIHVHPKKLILSFPPKIEIKNAVDA